MFCQIKFQPNSKLRDSKNIIIGRILLISTLAQISPSLKQRELANDPFTMCHPTNTQRMRRQGTMIITPPLTRINELQRYEVIPFRWKKNSGNCFTNCSYV